LKHKKTVTAAFLVTLVLLSLLVAYALFTPTKQNQAPSKPFYVGIETGWNSTVADCKALIDKVRDYTNLFIIASPYILSSETLLNQTCDYAYNAGMYFMPAYYQDLNNPGYIGYTPELWFASAKAQYGDRLLGIYFYDEPGGIQLDETVDLTSNSIYNATSQPTSYLDYANWYFHVWTQGQGVPVAANFAHNLNSSLFTSDYALYWFDYELGYDTVFAQFGWNNSRQLQISQLRGSAQVQDKTWGAIITWTYNQAPYLESGLQMYSDMVLAYNSGATYIAVYDSSQNYTSTTLTQSHFDALKDFWRYVKNNPYKQGYLNADIAVVLPDDYGFGFRGPDDSVWQYHTASSWTQKLYSDIIDLLDQYNSSFDIVYSNPRFDNKTQSLYGRILVWPQDFELGINYSVTDLNSGLGYDTIQEAISSFATYKEDIIQVTPGTYQENIIVNKSVELFSGDNVTTVISALDNGTSLTIVSDNVTVSGFTLTNSGHPSESLGNGLLLENAHNCSVIGNIITGNYVGIFLRDSAENTFRINQIGCNIYNLILQNATNNDIDASNIVDGKPYK
jgi:parallel beta-helix repeat protein